MASIESMINWMQQRLGKVRYSMETRLGPNTYDCSSSVYNALIAGGFFPNITIGNTTTLYTDLPKYGWVKTTSPKRGCIFLWGRAQSASGRYGHTGIFIDSANVIHCNGSAKTISIGGYAAMIAGAGNPAASIWVNPSATDTTPSLNTPEEKVAWAVANILNSYGYSRAAIAGILGNMDAESEMDPAYQEKGGCGYGLVQWTGNREPVDGVAPACGAQYLINYMNFAGIKGDYSAAEPQTHTVEWGMNHGDWIGKVPPLTVAEYKKTTDVSNAAYAFMKNYERPGIERLQDRIDAANKWYTWLGNTSYTDEKSEGYETLTNVGELELLGIAKSKIIAKGWHFSSNKDTEYIVFMNARTGKEIGRVKANPVKRPDIKEKYPKVLGVENSGFNVSFAVPNGTAVYVKGIRTDGKKPDEKVFSQIIVFEQAFDPEVDNYAITNEKPYFEILRNGKVVKLGKKILNELSWSNELMYMPETELVLPIEYAEYLRTREEVKIYINQKLFHGIALNPEEDKTAETITVTLRHVIYEWTYRQISTNLAAKNRTVNDIYSTYDFRYPGWNVEYTQNAAEAVIDYVYSRQDKLAGLTKTCELTNDLFWRVGFYWGRTLDIGSFGDKKPYMLSTRPSGKKNIRIISEPVIRQENENVINMATVYGEKGDSGMSSLSLREVFTEEGSQIEGFPVRILLNDINNERGYDYIEFSTLAPNNKLEYTVIDTEGIALEGGAAIEGTFSFNDIAPFAIAELEDKTNKKKTKAISEEDRGKAAQTAYEAAIKKLKQSRRRYIIEVETERIPYDVNVGDKIRLVYDNKLLIMQDCSNYQKKILSMDDWYYITAIDYNFDKNGFERNTLSLEKYLQIDRESDEQ